MVMPGDNTEMVVELGKPIAMEEGLRFAIREGGRTVGAGRVIKIEQVAERRAPDGQATSGSRSPSRARSASGGTTSR